MFGTAHHWCPESLCLLFPSLKSHRTEICVFITLSCFALYIIMLKTATLTFILCSRYCRVELCVFLALSCFALYIIVQKTAALTFFLHSKIWKLVGRHFASAVANCPTWTCPKWWRKVDDVSRSEQKESPRTMNISEIEFQKSSNKPFNVK